MKQLSVSEESKTLICTPEARVITILVFPLAGNCLRPAKTTLAKTAFAEAYCDVGI